MARLWALVVLLLVLTVPAGLWADEAAPAATSASPAELFAAMLKSQGQAYATARGELLCSGAAEALLRPRAADPDWRVAAIARAGLDRLSRPAAHEGYQRDLERAARQAFGSEPGPLQDVGLSFRQYADPGNHGPPEGTLNDAAAVPFLLEALLKGAVLPPDWWPPMNDVEPRMTEVRKERAETYLRVTQCYAALALGALNDPEGFGPLVQLVHTGEFPELRAYAAVGLGWTERTEAVAPLREALGDVAAVVRQGAAASLGRLLTTPNDPALARLAESDPDAGVRASAIAALAIIDSRVRALRGAESDGH